MKVKVTGEAVGYQGKTYAKGEELNVSKEQFEIWERLDLAKAANTENKGQQKSATKSQSAKKGIGNGKGKGAAKKAENAAKNENKTTGETFTPIELPE